MSRRAYHFTESQHGASAHPAGCARPFERHPLHARIYWHLSICGRKCLIPFGFSRPDALAYILISQVVGYLVISFWGLIGLWQINRV